MIHLKVHLMSSLRIDYEFREGTLGIVVFNNFNGEAWHLLDDELIEKDSYLKSFDFESGMEKFSLEVKKSKRQIHLKITWHLETVEVSPYRSPDVGPYRSPDVRIEHREHGTPYTHNVIYNPVYLEATCPAFWLNDQGPLVWDRLVEG